MSLHFSLPFIKDSFPKQLFQDVSSTEQFIQLHQLSREKGRCILAQGYGRPSSSLFSVFGGRWNLRLPSLCSLQATSYIAILYYIS